MTTHTVPQRLLALLCALLLIPLCASAEEKDTSALDAEVAKKFGAFRTTGGMVVAAKDGQIVYKYCYGYADSGKKALVTEDSYFRLASVSKLVTACAVMRLVDAGKLDLDENIGHIIGEQIKSVVNNVVFPALDMILVIFFFVKLGSAYFDYRQGNRFDWAPPAILFVCLVFTLTAPTYIWTIIGA